MKRNSLSELNLSVFDDLISTSYLSLLSQFCHIVTATPVNLCVYYSVLCVSVKVCKWMCVWVFCTSPSLLLLFFLLHCGWIIYFIFLICKKLALCCSQTSSCLRVGFGSVPILHSWYFCVIPSLLCVFFLQCGWFVDCTLPPKYCSLFKYFLYFPLISYGGHFWLWTTQVWQFFLAL